jgi:hypothetical protein
MIDYGTGPDADELEVTVFGPGYGEAIAVHLGGSRWMLVDSCLDPDTRSPASLTYLNRIGVSPDNVISVIASHWHDDHVRGFSKIVRQCPAAELNISATFKDEEALAFLLAYSGQHTPGLAKGAQELYQSVCSRDTVYFVHQRSNIIDERIGGRRIQVTTLSPVEGALAESVARLASNLPSTMGGTPIKHAPELEPNIESVVVHIDVDGEAILLGADLENHATHGWSAVLSDRWVSGRTPATAYKVAHHGSHTGEAPAIWTTLLRADPVACMTPFINGSVKLPSDSDKQRIRAATPHRYISSGASRRPNMDNAQLKRLNDICKNLTPINTGFGAVRLRKGIGQAAWQVKCFGDAQPL